MEVSFEGHVGVRQDSGRKKYCRQGDDMRKKPECSGDEMFRKQEATRAESQAERVS